MPSSHFPFPFPLFHRSKSRSEVRGKTIYLQHSNRQEIVNNKTTAAIAGNVLLVTIEGQDARLVSIDVLHQDHVKRIISNGSLVHPEKEHMCVCLLSPFLNTTSLPYLPPIPTF
ncbi:hypothetical protein Gotur_003719 [Gossypium turneri]